MNKQPPQGPPPDPSFQYELPNALLALILGILCVVLSLGPLVLNTNLFGIAGIIMGASVLYIVSTGKSIYETNPSIYRADSLNKLNIARLLAIIGIVTHFALFAWLIVRIVMHSR